VEVNAPSVKGVNEYLMGKNKTKIINYEKILHFNLSDADFSIRFFTMDCFK
jgi:hypothetical protein